MEEALGSFANKTSAYLSLIILTQQVSSQYSELYFHVRSPLKLHWVLFTSYTKLKGSKHARSKPRR